MKMLITLELDGIFGSNFVYLCILTLYNHWYEEDDAASPSIILAGRALLVKMLITLEPLFFLFFFFFAFFAFFFNTFVV